MGEPNELGRSRGAAGMNVGRYVVWLGIAREDQTVAGCFEARSSTSESDSGASPGICTDRIRTASGRSARMVCSFSQIS